MSLITPPLQADEKSPPVATPVPVQSVKLSPPKDRYWAGLNLKAAQTEAMDRGTPIIAIVLRDGDPICTSWAKQHMNDPKFLKVLENYGVPALVCLPDAEGNKHKSESENTTDQCPIAGCKSCDEHSTGELLVKDLPLPKLLPLIYLIDVDPKKSRPIPQEIPFRGAPALEEFLSKRNANGAPTRTQYRFLLKHLDRAHEYDREDDFEKGCSELAAANRLVPLFSPRLKDLWDQAYAPYRGQGIQMIRRSKAALKTNPLLGTRMLTRVAKIMADLPEGERARHLLNAINLDD